jgi:hypothetical protein
MTAWRSHFVSALSMLAGLGFLVACGGGSSSSSGPPMSPAPIAITTPSILPGTITNHPYSVTLAAVNGQGSLKWSIAPLSSTALFVSGLSIDANTGVLSGTPIFEGTGGFIATVTDSASHTATKEFLVTVSPPLTGGPRLAFPTHQFQDVNALSVTAAGVGGVSPLTYNLASVCLPVGLRLDSTTGNITGSPVALGSYACEVNVTDSFNPPEWYRSRLLFR